MKNYNNLIHPEEKNTLLKLNTAIDTIENTLGVKDIIQSVGASNDSDYGFCVANYIQAGKVQYSEVYAILEELCKEINISKPNLFIKSDNKFEHFTIGKAPYNIVLSSGLVNLLDKDGLKVVIAHECGHIKFNHVQYTNMLQHLMRSNLLSH
jgi:Zn-dependent protease with chaperone function